MPSGHSIHFDVVPLIRSLRLHGLMEELLSYADIKINGQKPWDIQLRAPGVPEAVFSRGNLGFGEAYIDGAWEVEQLDEFFHRVLRAHLPDRIQPLRLVFPALCARLLNRQTVNRAWQVGKTHYDLGNTFYAAMLDPRMAYTCGYWEHASTLAEAQEA